MEKNNASAMGGYIQLPICDKTVTTELSDDFTLPDYQPEIKRLLKVTAKVMPPSRYISDRQAEFAGGIDYYVLYVGSDNCLYCAPISAEYKVDVPLDCCDGDGESYLCNLSGSAVSAPDMINGRVTAPRKLSIKCRLRTRARIFGDLPIEDGLDMGDGDMQILSGNACAVRRIWGGGEMLRLTDEMICDNREGDVRVVMAEGQVMMSEISPAQGSVTCRGEVYLKLLLCREDGGMPYTVMRKLPFSQSIAINGADPASKASATGTVSELGITVEDGRISTELGILNEVECCVNERVAYVKDVYSSTRNTECKYRKREVPSYGESVGGNFTLSDSAPIEEVGITSGSRVIDVWGNATIEGGEQDGGKCSVSGKAKMSLLLEKDGEYSSVDMELPFNYKCPVSGAFTSVMMNCTVASARARMDGERVGVDAEVYLGGHVSACKDELMLTRVELSEAREKERGEVVIYYPAGDDSLWSAAKRYGVPFEAVAQRNGLSSELPPDSLESLGGKKYLIV